VWGYSIFGKGTLVSRHQKSSVSVQSIAPAWVWAIAAKMMIILYLWENERINGYLTSDVWMQ